MPHPWLWHSSNKAPNNYKVWGHVSSLISPLNLKTHPKMWVMLWYVYRTHKSIGIIMYAHVPHAVHVHCKPLHISIYKISVQYTYQYEHSGVCSIYISVFEWTLKCWSSRIPAYGVFIPKSTVGSMNTTHQLSNVMIKGEAYKRMSQWLLDVHLMCTCGTQEYLKLWTKWNVSCSKLIMTIVVNF